MPVCALFAAVNTKSCAVTFFLHSYHIIKAAASSTGSS
jgi:hypothetical protein